MSVLIKDNNITMTRGDTLKIKVSIFNKDGEAYIPVEGDQIRFALKKNYTDGTPLILKKIPYDTLELRLESSDTKKLDMPAEYVYDIQITMNDGTVDTFIKGSFKTTEEVD